MAKLLKRTMFGDPLLRQKSRVVSAKEIKSFSIKQFISDMFYTMRRQKGVGLAAPQVNKNLQIAVIEIKPSKVRPLVKPLHKTIVINPRIMKQSRRLVYDWEGCLSFPGVRGLVPRSESVLVTFTNHDGEKSTMRLLGFQARVFQHEIDHLNGTLFVDRMSDMSSLMTLSEFKKRILGSTGLKSK